MYLKSLEMVGFKSFADRTKLDFEPGMTAIVGPNGCGKSNVSDAIRWVLGEQSAKALRGSKMEDCIFNGTDARKPLGMAEVNITFADCEETLGTEYNEVTISRRVFRSGEGQYLINKTPCRLKDIQRLFMDTGIGTTSYSVMEQGRIDQILSSRPEDRRTVFEEASGITKFKADKKEAIRKLEHTEANLLRLADVIREVKRQIGSLQRQAGKARRYKTFREELRKLEIYSTRENLKKAGKEIRAIEDRIAEMNAGLSDAHQSVEAMEENNAERRNALMEAERQIGAVLEAGVQGQSRLDHTHELIRVNQQRIDDYRNWSQRDAREIDESRKQVEAQKARSAELAEQDKEVRATQATAEKDLNETQARFNENRAAMEHARQHLHQLREDAVELESAASRLQNELVELDSRQRMETIQRERLAAEKSRLTREVGAYDKRRQETAGQLAERRREAEIAAGALNDAESRRREISDRLKQNDEAVSELKAQASALEVRVEMLREDEENKDGFPAGSRLLLGDDNPLGIEKDRLLGTLASLIEAEPEYATALEAVLRTSIDAVVVSDTATAVEWLTRLEARREGPCRLLAANADATSNHGADAGGDRLLDHVRCDDAARPLVRTLLSGVVVVDSLEAVPASMPATSVFVTRGGCLVRGDGRAEFWMRDPGNPSALARKQALVEGKDALTRLQADMMRNRNESESLRQTFEELGSECEAARTELEKRNRVLAQKEGENEIVSKEAAEAGQRLETVTWELQNMEEESPSSDSHRDQLVKQSRETAERRETIAADINELNRLLRELESVHAELQTELTDRRIRFAQVTQKVENIDSQRAAVAARIEELEAAIAGRSEGLESYEQGIEKLKGEIEEAQSRLVSLQKDVETSKHRAAELRAARDERAEELKDLEKRLASKRDALENLRNEKAQQEIRRSEAVMRRDNMLEKVTSEYKITAEAVMDEPEPEWGDDGCPDMDTVETKVTELRTKIEAMGPVNLVAIEEYQELEERYNFLTQQEEDLVKSKQQLMDMIRKINRTTSEMFQSTFEQVNANFEQMFKRLFNGGTAKLVLVNEEDVLECGIEIIARPPGKRLQNISLLSGGERTMTAVSLLFAIYMIKPSPFCLLDEIDAALDDSNIGRFVGILVDFLQQSQFVVITHNRQTIAAAHILYGVTMPEKGVSRIVSVRFKDHERQEAETAETS